MKTSDLQSWIASYKFGCSSHNNYLQAIKSIFEIVVADKDEAIVVLPAASVRGKKVREADPRYPNFREFTAIIADVRQQNHPLYRKWHRREGCCPVAGLLVLLR